MRNEYAKMIATDIQDMTNDDLIKIANVESSSLETATSFLNLMHSHYSNVLWGNVGVMVHPDWLCLFLETMTELVLTKQKIQENPELARDNLFNCLAAIRQKWNGVKVIE